MQQASVKSRAEILGAKKQIKIIMKDLKYAFSLIIPIVTALFLIALSVVAAELIIEFYSSRASKVIIETIIKQPENGIWAISGALFGSTTSIILLVFWDVYKDYRYTKKIDDAIMNSIEHEFESCAENIQHCIQHLERELVHLNETPPTTLIAEPPIIKLEFWDLLKTHIPKSMAKDKELLSNLRNVSNMVSYFNNQLNSREQYHIHCKALINFNNEMKIYDENLLTMLEPITKIVDSFTVTG